MKDDFKKCSNCFELKEKSEFYPRRGHGDGHQSRCKACHAEVMRGWRETKRVLLKHKYRGV